MGFQICSTVTRVLRCSSSKRRLFERIVKKSSRISFDSCHVTIQHKRRGLSALYCHENARVKMLDITEIMMKFWRSSSTHDAFVWLVRRVF